MMCPPEKGDLFFVDNCSCEQDDRTTWLTCEIHGPLWQAWEGIEEKLDVVKNKRLLKDMHDEEYRTGKRTGKRW